jgi:shikimate dehydrogenase
MNFIGVNLTVPHKLLAVEMMDALDESTKTWGAVNTVRFEGKDERGVWRPLAEFPDAPRDIRSHGFNTDADAITRSLREDLGLDLAGASVLLLGAGGAGRTAALKLASESVAELYLLNRTLSKAEVVAKEIHARFPSVKVTLGYPAKAVSLVLNATSLGLKPGDPLPFDEKRLSFGQANAVYDMIYRPAETPLLKAAKAAGCPSANGLGMLLYQGAKALELWTGQNAPIEVMRQALKKNIYG